MKAWLEFNDPLPCGGVTFVAPLQPASIATATHMLNVHGLDFEIAWDSDLLSKASCSEGRARDRPSCPRLYIGQPKCLTRLGFKAPAASCERCHSNFPAVNTTYVCRAGIARDGNRDQLAQCCTPADLLRIGGMLPFDPAAYYGQADVRHRAGVHDVRVLCRYLALCRGVIKPGVRAADRPARRGITTRFAMI